jgi:hypothetical protein
MQGEGYDVYEALEYLDPSQLNYSEWETIGAILKYEGFSCSVWDDWSKRDMRPDHGYKPGKCEEKWRTFKGGSKPAKLGTLFKMALDRGWRPHKEGHVIDWNDTVSDDGDFRVLDPAWVDPHPSMPKAPTAENPEELAEYIRILFKADEYVGLVMDSSYNEERDKFNPAGSGYYTRTAGEWLDLIEQYQYRDNPFSWITGDYDKAAGAWIRFNPLDGKGVNDDNVTSWRYALVESDDISIEKQYSLITELQLPVAVMVHSGGKSVHAIVHVDAKSQNEYREKVKFLYEVCEANGLRVDQNNKNPSRLSRMPGVERGDRCQYIVARNIGKPTWQDWVDYIEDLRDDLPDISSFDDIRKNPPELAPELIKGVLRQGHKMLLSGPSKAGKSFALIELAIAIAEGRDWFGHPCRQGRVLYLNFEVDEASFDHRIMDVYERLGIHNPTPGMIDIWHLRGATLPLDKLVPKLIRRAKDAEYRAVIFDPVYKVLTGDENNASEMAAFCNQFDKVCRQLGASTIYCHHHSKGAQSGKVAMDRASGSGVFARDPDALVDFLQMKVPPENIPEEGATGWKISYTLREFAPIPEDYYWYVWPLHVHDEEGYIKRTLPDTEPAKASQAEIKNTRIMNFPHVYKDLLDRHGRVTVSDMAENLLPDNDGNAPNERTIRNYIREHLSDEYYVSGGNIFMKTEKENP